MTLEQIITHENQLLAQIAQAQWHLAAYRRVRFEREQALLAPAPEPVPPPANLEKLSKGYGGGIRLVTWAIRQLPGDFGIREIAAVLQQVGYPLRVRQLSVILNRMKDERKITEVWKGRGRSPSLFRATPDVLAVPLALAARHRTLRAVRYHISR